MDMGAASDDQHIQPLRSLKQQESSVIERQPSFLVASASMLQRTASRLMGPHTQPMRPEDRAGPPPSIPPEDWVDKPCALRFVPSDAQVIRQEGQLPDSMVRAQIPFEIDSEIFKGRMVVYVRGLTNTPSDIFAGKRGRSNSLFKANSSARFPWMTASSVSACLAHCRIYHRDGCSRSVRASCKDSEKSGASSYRCLRLNVRSCSLR